MEEFALIKSRVNFNRVNLGIALISDLKVRLEELKVEGNLRTTKFSSAFMITHFISIRKRSVRK